MAFYQVANTPESVTGHICIFMIIQAKRVAFSTVRGIKVAFKVLSLICEFIRITQQV